MEIGGQGTSILADDTPDFFGELFLGIWEFLLHNTPVEVTDANKSFELA